MFAIWNNSQDFLKHLETPISVILIMGQKLEAGLQVIDLIKLVISMGLHGVLVGISAVFLYASV